MSDPVFGNAWLQEIGQAYVDAVRLTQDSSAAYEAFSALNTRVTAAISKRYLADIHVSASFSALTPEEADAIADRLVRSCRFARLPDGSAPLVIKGTVREL